jgi:uncharacterized delta-60 repeat protein
MKHTSSLLKLAALVCNDWRRRNKVALLQFSIALLLAGGAAAVRGQSALDGFNPNANGLVQVVVIQPDGKILIGGYFTALTNNAGVAVTRNHIARLNADGSLDTAFNPDAGGTVYAIAVQSDGKVLVGGQFGSVGGQSRPQIARLDAITGAPDSWTPNPNLGVEAIAVHPDGKILVGGLFSTVGGNTHVRIARLDATTGVADSWTNANNEVYSIAVQADGKILVGGAFTSIGGQLRNRIARLDATNGLADSFDPNANSGVQTIVVQADGKILACGYFTSIGGTNRNYIARLDAVTGAADSWNPNADHETYAIAVQPDGKILAGGTFFTIGGTNRNHIARLDAVTGAADSFNPNLNQFGFVYAIAVQSDGKILVGGDFTSIGGQKRNRIARLEVRPLLKIQRSANTNFVMSWPTNFPGFTLETSTNLTPNSWSTVSPAPALTGTNNVVTNAASGPTRFYRLRQ